MTKIRTVAVTKMMVIMILLLLLLLLPRRINEEILISTYNNYAPWSCADSTMPLCRTFCHSRRCSSSRSADYQHRMVCRASVADVEWGGPCGKMPCCSPRTDTWNSCCHTLLRAGADQMTLRGSPTRKKNKQHKVESYTYTTKCNSSLYTDISKEQARPMCHRLNTSRCAKKTTRKAKFIED